MFFLIFSFFFEILKQYELNSMQEVHFQKVSLTECLPKKNNGNTFISNIDSFTLTLVNPEKFRKV